MDIRSKIEERDWAWGDIVTRNSRSGAISFPRIRPRVSESLFLVETGVWTLFDLHEYGVFENPKSMATVDQ